MDNGMIAIVVALVGALSAPVVAFFASRRVQSGKISTSEASELWDEGSDLRNFLREEITRIKTEFEAHKEQTTKEMVAFQEANSKLTQQLRESLDVRRKLEEELDHARAVLARNRNESLRLGYNWQEDA